MAEQLSSLSSIDAQDARWVSREIDNLLQQVGPHSVVSLMLKQTRQELNSLVPETQASTQSQTPVLKIAA